MGVFSAAPKCFKVDRKSHFAVELKSLILDHLRNFCPDFADDVLAEYITVLVCNGKNQNQAREDLEAFLGEKSEAFVSWLWDMLLKYESSSSAKSSDRKEKTSFHSSGTCKESNNRRFRGMQSQGNSESDNLMDNAEGTFFVTAKPCGSRDAFTREEHISRPAKDTISRTIRSSGMQRKSAHFDSSAEVGPSVVEQQSERVDKPEPIKRSSSLSRRHPGYLSESDPLSNTRSTRGIKLSEHPRMHAAPMKSISPPPQVVSSRDNMPRRSVWDRLGKPQENVPTRNPTADFNVGKSMRIAEEWVGSHPPVHRELDKQTIRGSPMLPSHRDRHVDEVRDVHQIVIVGGDGTNKTNGSDGAHDVAVTKSEVPSASTIRRKRLFGDLANEMGDVASSGVRQAHKRQEVPLEASQVVDSMHDVKLRMRQVELEVAKLRAKQIEMENEGKAKLLMNRGVVKAAEDDTDSRTVLVTNLHHKATMEALSVLFGKCGAVVNIVTLADSNPIAPVQQRSAYITFGSKESAERALGFNGTTLYSRTILVSRKADTAGASSTKLLAHASLPKHTTTPDKSAFARPHLQWRRESLTSTQPEIPPSKSEQSKEVTGSASRESPEAPPSNVQQTQEVTGSASRDSPEAPPSNVQQTQEVAGSASLEKDSAALVSDQNEDLKQHPSASADKPSEAEAEAEAET